MLPRQGLRRFERVRRVEYRLIVKVQHVIASAGYVEEVGELAQERGACGHREDRNTRLATGVMLA